MKYLFWWVVTIVGSIWLSCQELPAQTFKDTVGMGDTERHKFLPPSTYAMLWYEVENCLGVQRDFREVTFYWVQADVFDSIPCDGGTCYGYYVERENSITLSNSLLWSEVLVKHEMIHALGVHGHPPDLFVRCANHRVGTRPQDGPYIPGRIMLWLP